MKYLYIFLIDPKMIGKMKLQTIHGDTLISGKSLSTGRCKRWWMWWWQWRKIFEHEDRDGDQDEGEDDDGDESILSEGESVFMYVEQTITLCR